ncbi:MAG: hypothetical protein QOI02_368 [Actinomycetota bacterium]|nr:hypothetical protein [Actinomycetota bacterium]
MKKFAAAFITALLAVGLALVGVAAPASAHTSKVTGVAACQTDGTYTVTWTYVADNVPDNKEAETKVITFSPSGSVLAGGVLKGGQLFLSVWTEHQVNVPGVPVKTGNWTKTFTQSSIPGTANTATVMVQTDWKNGPSTDETGTVTLDGNCKKPTPADAKASVTITPATCESGETVKYGEVVHATLTGTADGTKSGSYDITATADQGHKFAAGATTHWSGTLKPADATKCAPPAACIPNSAVHYTYSPATNSGNIHVDDVKSVSGQLCDPLYVTATSWHYTTNTSWPQTLDVVQKLPVIKTAGDYPYVAAVSCGQGDIYAARGVLATWITPTATLSGPSVEFQEHFLSDMGYDGPKPTYTQTPIGCQQVTVVVPTAKAITACGTDGSLTVPADTYQVDYTVTGNGKTGINTVTAVALHGAVLVGYPSGGWTFDLGQHIECSAACTTITDGGSSTDTHPNGWTFQLGANGHNDYIATGLRVWTTSADAAGTSAGLHAADFPLSQVGSPELTFLNTSGNAAPGITLVIYNGGTKIGTLTRAAGSSTWSLDVAVAGVPATGTIDQFRQAFANKGVTPTVKAVGYSLSAIGDGTITTIVVGCTSYTFTKEVLAPTVKVELGTCVADGDVSTETVKFTFDNTASNVDATFTVEGTAISKLVKAGESATVDGSPVGTAGAVYKIDVNGVFLQDLAVEQFDGCVEISPVDPTATPGTCVAGSPSNGNIHIELDSRLSYTVHAADGSVISTDVADTSVPAGDYYVTVLAQPGYVLKDSEPVKWPFSLTVGGFEECSVTTGSPTFTTATCDPSTRNWAILPAVDGGEWVVTRGDKAPVTLASYEGGPEGDYTTFTASLQDADPADQFNVVETNFGAWQPVDVSTLDCTLTAVVAPDASSCTSTQPEGFISTTWVRVTLRDDVIWTLDAGTANETVLTTEYTDTVAGNHTLTATSNKAGFTLVGQTLFPVTVVDTFDCLPTFADLPANVTSTSEKCVSNSVTGGTMTFEFPSPVETAIYYNVTNVSTGHTTKVTSSNAVLKKTFAAGKYTVRAHVVDTVNDRIDTNNGAKDRWTITIAAASVLCGGLTTLAFTGTTGAIGFMLAGGMLFLGAAAFFMRRRFGHVL